MTQVFESTIEKQQGLYKELKSLLAKYNAELILENVGNDWSTNYKIIVEFAYDESFFEKEDTGIIPDLIIGNYLDGK